MPHQPADSISLQLRIGIDTDDKVRLTGRNPIVQSRCLPAVLLCKDSDFPVVAELFHDLSERMVFAPVVHQIDVECRIVLLFQIVNSADNIHLFIIGRNDYRHRRCRLGIYRSIAPAVFCPLLTYHQDIHEDKPQETENQKHQKKGREEVADMVNQFCQTEVCLHGIILLAFLYRRHESLTIHAEILFQRDELIAFAL